MPTINGVKIWPERYQARNVSKMQSVFNMGGPVVIFRKKNGGSFEKHFKSRASASKAIRAWRKKGGKIKNVFI